MKKQINSTFEKKKFPITKKQKEIIQFLYRFRYLNRIHIQKLLYHKDYRRINAWLLDLTQKEYVGRIYNNVQGENREASIYYLGKLGKSYLESVGIKSTYLKTLRSENIKTLLTRNHALAVADIYILLRTFSEKEKTQLEFLTKPDYSEEKWFKHIQPDAYFIYDHEYSYFLELDLETEAPITLKKRLTKYLRYYYINNWHHLSKDYFPAICVISLTEKHTKHLMGITEQLLRTYTMPPVVFKFTTLAQLKNKGLNGAICSMPFSPHEYFYLI